jgi:methionine-rich copper-binding protein CopC
MEIGTEATRIDRWDTRSVEVELPSLVRDKFREEFRVVSAAGRAFLL